MTTSNNSTNNGSNCGSNYGTTPSTNSASSGCSTTATAMATSTATCTEHCCGTTLSVNEISTPGCYVANWNGSLMRVGETCFTSAGFTAFNYTSCEPLTVTYLTDDPTATVEECRTWAHGANVYCNF